MVRTRSSVTFAQDGSRFRVTVRMRPGLYELGKEGQGEQTEKNHGRSPDFSVDVAYRPFFVLQSTLFTWYCSIGGVPPC
jgi:hypothetical protein